MKKVAYFDISVGVSGDMVLGALVDAGLSPADLQSSIDALGLDGVHAECRRVVKNSISAMKVDIQAPHEHVHRGLADIVRIIEKSDLPDPVRSRAISVFERLAKAEARVHGTTVDAVHFHEVGAVDAIADIVGAVAGLHSLGVDSIHASPIPLSHGTVHAAHGEIPVPPPAVLGLLEDVPVTGLDIEGETVTPTGAALMTTLVESWGAAPSMVLRAVGYGAGDSDFRLPNVLRLLIGDSSPAQTADGEEEEVLFLLETNVDDMSPEWLGPILGDLISNGALDAWITPVLMKKGRPGAKVSALTTAESRDALRQQLFSATSTLGVRETFVSRRSLSWSHEEVQTQFGPIRLKLAQLSPEERKVAPEFEDCWSASKEHSTPLQSVYAAALAAWEGREQ